MAEMKTKETDASVDAFLNGVTDENRRNDCYTVLKIMEKASGAPAKMWGPSIIGFGNTHYEYASGREGDWFLIGFSPRKQNLTLYISGGLERYAELLQRLGKYKTGKGCLYVKKLEDIDVAVLGQMAAQSIEFHRLQQ
jgi:hypothetical protein